MEGNCTIFPVEGKRQVKDEETEITYIILYMLLTPTVKDVTMTLILLWSKDTVRIQTIQELRLEPLRSNDPCIKEFSLEVLVYYQ